MPSVERLAVHRLDEGGQAARVVAAQRVGGAVLRRHQRQVQHLAAGQLGADVQARAAALLGVESSCGDRQHLVQRQLRLGDDQRRHQLGDRGDRQHRLRVLAEQHLVGVLVDHQRDAGLQVERIVGARAGRSSWPKDGRAGSTRTARRGAARLALALATTTAVLALRRRAATCVALGVAACSAAAPARPAAQRQRSRRSAAAKLLHAGLDNDGIPRCRRRRVYGNRKRRARSKTYEVFLK